MQINKHNNEDEEKAHIGGCDVRRAGGVCAVRESWPHAGRPGSSGLAHMCLEGVRGSEKEKPLVKDFGGETVFAERKI